MTVSTKFEVDTPILCLVISLLLLIRYVTLTFDLLTFVSGQTRHILLSNSANCTVLRAVVLTYATIDNSVLYDLRKISIVYDAVEETRVTVYTVVYRPCPRHSMGRVRSHLRAV